MHAKAMLLIDHGEGEIAEAHILLEKRMRADHDIDLACGECGLRAALRFRRHLAREKREANARLFAERCQALGMLAREDIRGGH